MRAAATRSLERTKLYISNGIEQNKLDTKKKEGKGGVIIYQLLNAEKVLMNYQQWKDQNQLLQGLHTALVIYWAIQKE